MEILLKHWLGTTWVIFGVWGMYATSLHPKEPAILPLFLAGIFFWGWVIRGFVRLIGRIGHNRAPQR